MDELHKDQFPNEPPVQPQSEGLQGSQPVYIPQSPNAGPLQYPQQPYPAQCPYGQPPYGQVPNGQIPYDQMKPAETPEEKKKANRLCLISAILLTLSFVTVLCTFLIPSWDSSASEAVKNIAGFIVFGGGLVSLILMIVARSKYPKNHFAKILMWIYVSLFVLGVIITILAVLSIYAYCFHGLYSCRNANF